MRCLILSAGVGGGHVRAAQAIEKAFRRWKPDAIVKHVDALDFVTEAMRFAYVVPYLNLVNHLPEIWGYLYKQSADKKVDSKTNKIRSIATKLQSGMLKALLEEFRPDHVIATHFLALDAFTGKGGARKYSVPVSCVITDYAVHSFWLRSWVDRWFVANEEVADVMVRRGFEREKIQVTGLPVDPAFVDAVARLDAHEGQLTDEGMARAEARPASAKRRLRVLLMGGGFGVGHMADAAKAILGMRGEKTPGRAGRRVHLTAVAGKNEETKEALEALAAEIPYDSELTVRGFIGNVEEEMAKSDVLVSKAGGLTVTEALVMGLPMFLLDPIPGQEEHNADFLLEEGAAKTVGSLDALEYKLDRAIAEPGWLAKMKERARAIRKPNASREIVEAAVRLVHPEALDVTERSSPSAAKK